MLGSFLRKNFPRATSSRGNLSRRNFSRGNLTRENFPRGILPRGSSPDTGNNRSVQQTVNMHLKSKT